MPYLFSYQTWHWVLLAVFVDAKGRPAREYFIIGDLLPNETAACLLRMGWT